MTEAAYTDRWGDLCDCGHRRRAHGTVRNVDVACVFCDCQLFTGPDR